MMAAENQFPDSGAASADEVADDHAVAVGPFRVPAAAMPADPVAAAEDADGDNAAVDFTDCVPSRVVFDPFAGTYVRRPADARWWGGEGESDACGPSAPAPVEA